MAIWTRGSESLPYAFLSSGGTSGFATRLTAKPGEQRGVFLVFLDYTAAPKGKPQEFHILIWNDHVFYPECRGIAPS
jgi:hypothetical protein